MRKPYPKYRESGVPWLGDVPAHWEVRRLKELCNSHGQYGANVPATQYEDTGVRFLRTTDITEEGSLTTEGVHLQPQAVAEYILNHGDLLLSRSGTVGRSLLYQRAAHGPCAFAGYLVRFVPKTYQLARYIHLFTKSAVFGGFLRTEAISATIENVNAEKYANCQIPIPPHDEQCAIAAFLDRETSLIDQLVAKHELQIERLAEYRNAAITRAVTRGLPPNAAKDAGLNPEPRLKPSGVEWIGDIPAHWREMRLKNAGRLISGNAFPEDIQGDPGQTIPFYKVGDLERSADAMSMPWTENTISPESASQIRARIIPPRAIIYAKIGEALKLNRRRLTSTQACIDNNMTAYVPNENIVTNAWAFYNLCVIDFREFANPGAVPSLSEGDQANIPFPVPPLDEQRAITEYLNQKTARIDILSEHAGTAIERLNEYRTALITAAVTGKIDVRESGAASEPTE